MTHGFLLVSSKKWVTNRFLGRAHGLEYKQEVLRAQDNIIHFSHAGQHVDFSSATFAWAVISNYFNLKP